jgi:hypothetical protein
MSYNVHLSIWLPNELCVDYLATFADVHFVRALGCLIWT